MATDELEEQATEALPPPTGGWHIIEP